MCGFVGFTGTLENKDKVVNEMLKKNNEKNSSLKKVNDYDDFFNVEPMKYENIVMSKSRRMQSLSESASASASVAKSIEESTNSSTEESGGLVESSEFDVSEVEVRSEETVVEEETMSSLSETIEKEANSNEQEILRNDKDRVESCEASESVEYDIRKTEDDCLCSECMQQRSDYGLEECEECTGLGTDTSENTEACEKGGFTLEEIKETVGECGETTVEIEIEVETASTDESACEDKVELFKDIENVRSRNTDMNMKDTLDKEEIKRSVNYARMEDLADSIDLMIDSYCQYNKELEEKRKAERKPSVVLVKTVGIASLVLTSVVGIITIAKALKK